jgi:hypothetical protein
VAHAAVVAIFEWLYRQGMKRQQQRQPKLAVRRDTLRELAGKQLLEIQGGDSGAGCTAAVTPPPRPPTVTP